jgi:hypothetical protein
MIALEAAVSAAFAALDAVALSPGAAAFDATTFKLFASDA